MIILYILLVLILLFPVVGKLLSTRPYKGPITDHFNGKKFQNLSRVSAKGFDQVPKYIRESKKLPWSKTNDFKTHDTSIKDALDSEINYLFVNHSTFFLQVGGLNILTDPIFSNYCSPVPISRMKRRRPPGILLDKLPKIDLVLVSHNHYDHMDKWSIKEISRKWNPVFVTGLGNAPILKKYGAQQVIEMDWWEEDKVLGLKITCTPTNHFSSRGLYDRNTSLWSGFVLETSVKRIYFLGDSGYGEIFKEIGDRFGPMDLSLIPIGAFKPRWFMGPIHVAPEEAVQVHLDVKSKKSIAMHYGTFALADDNPQEARAGLIQARIDKEVSVEEFELLEEGVFQRL